MSESKTPRGTPEVGMPPPSSATGPTAGLPVSAPSAGLAHSISAHPPGRLVTIRLVTASSDAPCDFWVGLATKGERSPTDLMDVGDVAAVFEEAATRGVNDDGPIMLSDAQVSPPRYIYLLPTPASDFRNRASWIQDLVQALHSWAPKAAGFYIAPQLVSDREAYELLLTTLAALIQASPTEEYYLLTGAYGVNALLNVALKLKMDVDGERVRLAVFH
jgi:hypothetical protein